MAQMAGSWLMASVCIERMRHRSSATLLVQGSSSVFIQRPLEPTWLNRNLDGAIGNRDWPEVMVVSR